MRIRKNTPHLLTALGLAALSCSQPKEGLRLNQLQVIGSHNSYKQAIERPVMELALARDSNAIGLDYYHLPLREQLDLGLRGLEIDVVHDPVGGRYAEPVALKMMKQKGVAVLPYDTLHELSAPGMKVLHVPDIDFRSHCLTFTGCLREIREWSDAHANHLPIIITINPKVSGVDEPGFTPVLPFTSAVLDSLDREILSAFPLQKLVTPDFVQGHYPSLRESVTTVGWPLVDSVRGKLLFVLDVGRTITDLYLKPSLHGKTMFVNVELDDPNAAFFIMNDPEGQLTEIQERIRAGFMVRTRADADTREARTNYYLRFEAAINSGAQLISTDYYVPALSPSGDFKIVFSDGKYQRCNPVITTGECEPLNP